LKGKANRRFRGNLDLDAKEEQPQLEDNTTETTAQHELPMRLTFLNTNRVHAHANADSSMALNCG
jgi:hypothetical protein